MKGDGANVDPFKAKLTPSELRVLSYFYNESPKSAQQIANFFSFDIRKASSILSNLVGMDLLKSSSYRVTLTEEESRNWEADGTPVYFIGAKGTPIYNRAHNVITNNGILELIHAGHYDFALNLWPRRNSKQIQFVWRPDAGPFGLEQMLKFIKGDVSCKYKITVEKIAG